MKRNIVSWSCTNGDFVCFSCFMLCVWRVLHKFHLWHASPKYPHASLRAYLLATLFSFQFNCSNEIDFLGFAQSSNWGKGHCCRWPQWPAVRILIMVMSLVLITNHHSITLLFRAMLVLMLAVQGTEIISIQCFSSASATGRVTKIMVILYRCVCVCVTLPGGVWQVFLIYSFLVMNFKWTQLSGYN